MNKDIENYIFVTKRKINASSLLQKKKKVKNEFIFNIKQKLLKQERKLLE